MRRRILEGRGKRVYRGHHRWGASPSETLPYRGDEVQARNPQGGTVQPQFLKMSEYHAEKIFERILVMLINEAADALFWNIASAQDIDNAMTKGVNYPKGLLAWADQKGISWCVHAMDRLYDEYREDRYRCSPLLRRMHQKKQTFY